MSEMSPEHRGIDQLLTRSLRAPVPALAPGFDQRLHAEIAARLRPRTAARRFVLIGYGIAAALTSVVLLRGEGLDWLAIAAAVAAPLGVLALSTLAIRRAALIARFD